jgi:signal transduction histidine kinase
VARGEVLGEAEIWESRRVRAFSLAERRMLQTLCQHAAGVIENARLFAETLQHADEVTTASEILHLLNATANVVESFPLISSAIKSITGCERVSMAMLDSTHAKVTLVALDRARAELPRGVQFPVALTAAATDVLAGHIHLTPDLEAELGYPAERQLYEAGFRSRLNLPLRVGTQIIGSLNLVWREVSGYMQANLPLLTQLVDAIALAVEKTRLLDETRRRDAILEALAYASGALLLPGDPNEVMPTLLAQLGQAAGVSRASIFYNRQLDDGSVWASLRHEWTAPGQTSKADDPEWQNLPYAAGGFDRWQQTLSAGRTLDGLVRDFPASERLPLERQAVLSLAVVPIISEGEWWGWLGFDDCQGERIWSGAEIEALKSVAGALGAYLARQRIETAEREQRALAEALLDAAAVLSSTLDLDEVLDRILADVGHVVPHESANIMLVEEGVARVVRNRDARGRSAENIVRTHRFAVDAVPNLRHMLDTGQPAIIMDTRNYPGWLETPDTQWIRSNVGAPIQIKGQVIGFITLDNNTPGFFTLAHAERLQAFAQQAGLAIENAQLYASIREHAEELEQRVDARTRELAEANVRLQELDRLKDQFISNVSHELRTPLTNIKLHLGLLEKRGAEVLTRYLPTLQRETERLRRLIEDLLDLSRLQTQPENLRRDFHALDDLLSEVLTVHAARADSKSLTLRHEPSPAPVLVPVDRAQMIQVFTNLIGNAVAYTPSEGQVIVSSVVTRVGSTPGVTIRFRNDGPLIPEEDLPHLFRRFYRGRTAHDSGEPGTGLGLAICREIIDRHGGQIEVTSSAAEGTTFDVWLPLS